MDEECVECECEEFNGLYVVLMWVWCVLVFSYMFGCS